MKIGGRVLQNTLNPFSVVKIGYNIFQTQLYIKFYINVALFLCFKNLGLFIFLVGSSIDQNNEPIILIYTSVYFVYRHWVAKFIFHCLIPNIPAN